MKKLSKSEMLKNDAKRRRFYQRVTFELPPQPQFRRFAFAIDSGKRTKKGEI